MPTIYPVIMCGGAGTRLWPLSRKASPKQFHALVGEKTMLQETIARAKHAQGMDVAAPSFVCALGYEDLVYDQCRAEGVEPLRVILEPCARNTAAVAAVIALEIKDLDPDGLILLLPADHHVDDPAAFWRAAQSGFDAAQSGYLTTFGIQPTRPETGYGYIRAGDSLNAQSVKVDAFVEKPNLETAQTYLDTGEYFWNAGIFLFTADAMVKAFSDHAADILKDSEAALRAGTRKEQSVYLSPEAFSKCRSDSIDYAIMEAASNVAMVTGVDIGWSDIGSWEVIAQRAADTHAEAIGPVTLIGGANNYIRSSGPFIAAIGVEDLIIVATPDSVLITTKDQTQHVKTVVEQLKTSEKTELL